MNIRSMKMLFFHFLCYIRRRGIITRVIPPEEGVNQSPNKVLKSPKGRKHSHSDKKLKSPTYKNHHGHSDDKSPKERTNSSSSSDSQPLSCQAKKCNSDSVFAKSPTGKTPRKSLDEDTPSKSKSRKHSAESCSQKAPSKAKKHSSDGKGTPSKSGSGDKIDKKPSTPSSKKVSEEKLASPKNNSPCDAITRESPKANKSPSTSKRKSSESEVIVIDDDADDQSSPQKQSRKVATPKEKPVYNWPAADQYKYEVRLYSDKGSKKKEKKPEVVIVQASVVRY